MQSWLDFQQIVCSKLILHTVWWPSELLHLVVGEVKRYTHVQIFLHVFDIRGTWYDGSAYGNKDNM
jgi:hypothetical protein